MNWYVSKRSTNLQAGVIQILALCFIVGTLAVTSVAQIDLGSLKIPGNKKPQPNNPVGNKRPQPNDPVGNKNPTTTNPNVTSGAGATREQVQSFQRDMRPYFKGMGMLRNMARTAATDRPVGCSTAANTRKALDEGAAFGAIIQQKYPGIENPGWTSDEDSMVGDFRGYAENRVQLAKTCLNATFRAVITELVESLNKEIGQIKSKQGFVLWRSFDDPMAMHTRLAEKYKESYALVGMTLPDDSVFAPYDAALKALVDAARQHAGEWSWPGIHRDAMIESKARGWFAKFEPKGQITRIGLMHADWQIDGPSGGIPKGRYKRGYIMFRKPGVQPCLIASFSYEQNYIGGGRFNDMAITSGMAQILRMQSCK